MSYILVIWTTVAMAGAGAGTQYTKDWNWKSEKDWRPIGEFANKELCESAVKNMNIKYYRCLRAK